MRAYKYKFTEKGLMFWGYLLILLIIILLASCGVRKSNVSKESSKNVEENKESSKGTTTKESSNSDESTVKEQNAKSDESQEVRVHELFWQNGVLKERITELINSRSIDNSTKDSKSLKTSYNRVDSVFNNTLIRKVVITERKKVKDVESDKSFVTSVGGKGNVIIVVLILVGAVFLYFYLKKRR